jgi:uncharacterized protein YkwD
MGKRSVSVGILAAIVAGFIAVVAPAANALTSVENCFYQAINSARASAGHKALTLESDLTSIARRHSNWMAGDGTIYHADSSSPHYKQGDNLAAEVSGNWWSAGENVGMGPDCQSIADAFMASPEHKANILDTSYNQVGVGVAFDSSGTVYVTEDFAGRPMSSTSTTTHHTTTVRHYTRTVTHRATTHRSAAPKVAPKAHPVTPAAVAQAAPMTVTVLIKLVGMDAQQVDPATGEAMGV